jgi:hypothetical protein
MNRRLIQFNVVALTLALLLVACGGLSTPVPSPGGPWYADAAGGNDSNDCLSPGSACATIQAAIDKADPGGTVHAAAGTYNETIFINKAIVLQGAGADNTLINANGNDRAVTVSFAVVEIRRLTMRNGSANSVGGNFANIGGVASLYEVRVELGSAGYGGGIYNNGDLDLFSTAVTGNTADRGAGIYNAANAHITADDVTVESNPSIESGAGLFNAGEFVATNSQFIGNTAEGEGGAIFNDTSGTVQLTDVLISSNGTIKGYSGGGFYNRGGFNLIDSTVENNMSTYNGGGGVNRKLLLVANSSFNQNTAEVFGGGLFNDRPNEILTITGGEFLSNQAHDGGGLFNRGTTNITGTVFDDNEAKSGGGIFNDANEIYLTNVSITNNRALTSSGGAGGGGLLSLGQGVIAVVTDSLVEGNQAGIGDKDVLGGGIYSSHHQLIVAGTTVRNNSAASGGGIAVKSGTFELHNSTVEQNHARKEGGGVWLVPYSSLSQGFIVRRSTISDNTADDDGGGLYNRGGDLTVDDSTISNNSAGSNGGGMFLHRGSVYRVTISGNTATSSGGGIFIADGYTVPMINSTISNNHAHFGGAVFLVSGDFYPTYVTIAENQTDSGAAIVAGSGSLVRILASIVSDNNSFNCSGGVIDSLGANLSDDGSCPFGEATDQQNTNPNLGPLQNNGGLTETHGLPQSSAALNTDVCHNNNLDQRKEPRPAGVSCDSGAYERQQTLIITTAIAPGLCQPAGNLSEAKFRSTALRDGQGLLIVLDVPGGLPDEVPQGGYPAQLNGMEFRCAPDPAYPDRLFCVGPETGSPLGSFSLFVPPCPEPVLETEFTIPLRPTATPIPTATPTPRLPGTSG